MPKKFHHQFIVYILFSFYSVTLYSQNKTISKKININTTNKYVRCATTQKLEEAIKNYPQILEKRAEIETHTQTWIQQNNNKRSASIITIPTVVHVLYTVNNQNSAMSDSRIKEQIDILTNDYRRLNSDKSKTPNAFTGVAADTEIEFCLANIDPQGNITTGITRTKTSVSNIGSTNKYYSTSKGGIDAWSPDSYLNIWVCELGGGVLGFTYPPGGAPNGADGVASGMDFFGKTGATAPYNKGRTTTHEVGHWLNLEHIWGDDNGCNGSDFVNDTPNQGASNFGCVSFPHISCNNGPDGDMFMNYMDYSDDACMNIFTQGQKNRMRSVLETGGYRSKLATSSGCSGTPSIKPKANFSASNIKILKGDCINFSDLTTNSPTSWKWTFQGATPSTSISQNPTNICFNSSGCKDITLIAFNSGGSDTIIKACYIDVVENLYCDTSFSNFGSQSTPTLYGSDQWGYISGHNNYNDLAKADFYTINGTAVTINGAKIHFTKAYAGSSTSSVWLKIWDGKSGSPGSVLKSKKVNISTLNLYPTETFITFTNPVLITGNYFIGIEFSPNGTPQDTVALIQNTDGESSMNTAWEKQGNGSWHAFNETPVSWGITTSLAIWPIVCTQFPTAVNEIYQNLDFSVFPNPAKETITISLEEIETKNFNIKVFDILGKQIMETKSNQETITIDVSNFSKGVYFLNVSTNKENAIKKIILN